MSPHHLAKVLAELARAGIVESIRGVGGGYRFAGNARRLTLFDVICHFEDLSPTDAERREPGERTHAGRAIATVLSEIDEIAQATFKSITIATMLQLMERQGAGRTCAAELAARRGGRGHRAAAARRRHQPNLARAASLIRSGVHGGSKVTSTVTAAHCGCASRIASRTASAR